MWQTPAYTKKRFERAGKEIICSDLEVGKRIEATEIINNWRASHAFPMRQIALCLEKNVIGPEMILVQRLKRLDSIIAKLKRYPTMNLCRMQDLGGCRIIVPDIPRLYEVVAKIEASLPYRQVGHTDYIKSPKESGYRGVHLIYQYTASDDDPYKGMFIEIQVRTRLEHTWATAVETLGAFTNNPLKAGGGSAAVLRFLALSSAMFAMEENTPQVPGTGLTPGETLSELRACNKKEHILDRLLAIEQTVARWENAKESQDGFYVLELNYRIHSVTVTHFSCEELEQAIGKYAELELQNELSDQPIDVDAVLVSAETFASLRDAYPNYFSDIRDFTQKIKKMLHMVEAETHTIDRSSQPSLLMCNFTFLTLKTEYAMFAPAAAEAERVFSTSPAMCAVGCRKALELAVKWVYAADNTMQMPYKDNLQSLIHEPSFRFALDSKTWEKLPFIIKLGNLAVHTERSISADDALISLRSLFEFLQWVEYCYGSDYKERAFDEKLIPSEKAVIDVKKAKEQESLLEEKNAEIEALCKQIQEMSAQYTAKKGQNQQLRTFTAESLSEFETRKHYIDIDMKWMGWRFDGKDADVWEEYPVDGMAGVTGQTGYADYVLFGRDGLPLAVVEAKRSCKDPNTGRRQAMLYADCLERKFGRRPMMFTTNGFETYFWDDQSGPQRAVSGIFSKADLQKLMNRRAERLELLSVPIDDAITDRYYQKEAIRAVCERIEQGFRKHLLVMATGTGKTRTASSLADVLSRGKHVTNILFLADRISLVKQARDNFRNYLPDMSLCNLCTNKDDRSARIVFSTYPTMLNAIDNATAKDGQQLFTPAHFDLIIIDESHRSIFKKYRAIFEYFDAILVGLTATPKTDVDRNTYDFFEMEHGVPTYAYDYETAVGQDHVLVPYYNYEVKLKFLEEGINYNDLSAEDRERYEEDFVEDGLIPDQIPSAKMNKFVFNETTVDTVLQDLMERGVRVAGGDRLGKTIIFAQNKRHAEFILERFNKLYPQHKGIFAQRVICDDAYAQTVIEDFKIPSKPPYIVVSVDMMDTGIDVPECVNLVFFKKVLSKTKFWQMIGRGTRLCKGLNCTDQLEGEYPDKRRFLIFDYCGNFEYFRAHKEGFEAKETKSLSENIFGKRVKLAVLLQESAYIGDEFQTWRTQLADTCHRQVTALNQELISVRMCRRYVEKYKERSAFQHIGEGDKSELLQHIAPLIQMEETDEFAKRFDNLMYGLMLASMEQMPSFKYAKKQLCDIASLLERKVSIPQVQRKLPVIQSIKTEAFWDADDILLFEKVRTELRDLIQFISESASQKQIFTKLTDFVVAQKEGEPLEAAYDFEDYRTKVNRYINEHGDTLAIYKLTHNIPLLSGDYQELSRVLTSELGSQKDYLREFGDTPFGLLVRKIAKLDYEAAMKAFSAFINDQSLNQKQIAFVHKIVNHIVQNGYMESVALLTKPPFDKPLSFTKLFDKKTQAALMKTINQIKENAVTVVA